MQNECWETMIRGRLRSLNKCTRANRRDQYEVEESGNNTSHNKKTGLETD